MRKDCHTCKHELFDKCCNDCLYGDPPSNWEAANYYVPDTNAEKIRRMSDEQLVDYIECPYNVDLEFCMKKGGCYDCILEWLKQPCE